MCCRYTGLYHAVSDGDFCLSDHEDCVTVIQRVCKTLNCICRFITEPFRNCLKVWNLCMLSHCNTRKTGTTSSITYVYMYVFYVWCVYCADGTGFLLEWSVICVNCWRRLYTILAPYLLYSQSCKLQDLRWIESHRCSSLALHCTHNFGFILIHSGLVRYAVWCNMTLHKFVSWRVVARIHYS